jgi:hypothetical protein
VLRRSLRNASKFDHVLLYNDACRESLPVRCPSGVGAACTTIKPTSPSPSFDSVLTALPASHSFCRLEILNSHHFRGPPPRPALTACCAASASRSGRQSLFLKHPNCDLGPPSILPRSTPLQWPLVLIRLPFRPHLPRGCPFVRLVVKSASVPPCPRRPGPINYAGSTASSSNKRCQHGKGLSDGPDHCPSWPISATTLLESWTSCGCRATQSMVESPHWPYCRLRIALNS